MELRLISFLLGSDKDWRVWVRSTNPLKVTNSAALAILKTIKKPKTTLGFIHSFLILSLGFMSINMRKLLKAYWLNIMHFGIPRKFISKSIPKTVKRNYIAV